MSPTAEVTAEVSPARSYPEFFRVILRVRIVRRVSIIHLFSTQQQSQASDGHLSNSFERAT
ncbi:MAG: hypothetical protein ACK56F_14065 [bacterium]